MRSYFFTGFLLLTVAACQNRQSEIVNHAAETNTNSVVVSESEESRKQTNELEEFFSDDKKIGLPNRNKVEVSNFKKLDGDTSNSNFVVIKFYSSGAEKQWKLKQTFEFDKDGIGDCDPKLEDFNNDGHKDLTYISAHPARGANEIRKLFIYDKKKDELIYIKNSEDYPNMEYNKDLDCIDTWRFYGGYSTEFLRIDGDKLKEFASVTTFDGNREIHLIDKNGKKKLLRKDKINEKDGFERYKNFNPPELYR